MINELFELWRKQSDLMKLQSAYAVIVVVTLVAAGLIGLLNQTAAWQILSITSIATIAFFVNLVSFALVNLVLPRQKPRVARRSQTQKRS